MTTPPEPTAAAPPAVGAPPTTPAAGDAAFHAGGRQLLASRVHTVVLVAISLGIAWLGARGSGRAAAHPPRSHLPQYLMLIALEWLLFFYVWRGLKRGGTPLAEVIGRRWSAWRDAWKVLLAVVVFWLAKQLILGLVQQGLALAGYSRTAEQHRTMALLAPRGAAESVVWVALSCSAGFVEEVVYRGYLQKQLAAWSGHVWVGVAVSALVFGVAHGYQGPLSVLVITCYGALFGILARVTRTLRPGIVQHGLEDTLGGLFGPR